MTKPITPVPDELDEILENLLGEYHEHKCLTCNGTNGGCINCRKTGFNQTPCLICDKDGIAFKNRKEAKAALQTLIADRERLADNLARIDEIRDIQEYYVADYIDTTAGKNIDNYLESRLAELKASNPDTDVGEAV